MEGIACTVYDSCCSIYMHIMQNGVYCPVNITDRVINVRPKHTCTTAKNLPVCAVDENGEYNSQWLYN